ARRTGSFGRDRRLLATVPLWCRTRDGVRRNGRRRSIRSALGFLEVRKHLPFVRVRARLEHLRPAVRRISSRARWSARKILKRGSIRGRRRMTAWVRPDFGPEPRDRERAMRRDTLIRALFTGGLITATVVGCKTEKGPPADTTPTFTLNGAQSADD